MLFLLPIESCPPEHPVKEVLRLNGRGASPSPLTDSITLTQEFTRQNNTYAQQPKPIINHSYGSTC